MKKLLISSTEINELKKFSLYLSKVSASITKRYFRTSFSVEMKSNNTPVSVVDKLVEEKIRDMILKEYPTHGIVGEEFGSENEEAEFKWYIDPIDGTKSFISGMLDFGTTIAFAQKNEPVFSLINHPILNETVIGDSTTTTYNGQPLKIQAVNQLSDSALLATDLFNIWKYHNQAAFDKLIKAVRIFKTWGNCYGYIMLVRGFADIMVDPVMSVWDNMAVVPIIQGAGGYITDWQGKDPISGTSIIACHFDLYVKVMEILNPAIKDQLLVK